MRQTIEVPQHELNTVRDIQALRETRLIKQLFKFYTLPWAFAAILACCFPYCLGIVPLHGVEICLCSFYYETITN
jgi:hypothetical protein